MIVAAALARRRLGRLSTSLYERTCPDCGYSLESSPDDAPSRTDPVQGIGPKRCTECGSPWPLVPPPIGQPL